MNEKYKLYCDGAHGANLRGVDNSQVFPSIVLRKDSFVSGVLDDQIGEHDELPLSMVCSGGESKPYSLYFFEGSESRDLQIIVLENNKFYIIKDGATQDSHYGFASYELGVTVEVATPLFNSGIKKVSSGYGHCAVLLENGQVFTRGLNNYNQCANGDVIDIEGTFCEVKVTGVLDIECGSICTALRTPTHFIFYGSVKDDLDKELCHRDVKIANILVKEITDSNIYVVLTDFGVSFKKNSYKPYQFKTGTEQYYDPEIEKYFNTEKRGLLEFPFKTETDLYALGVTLERLSNKTTINSTPLLKEIITSLKNSTLPTRMKMMNVLADISLATTIAFKDPKNRTQWDKYLHACVMNPNCLKFCPYNKNKRFIYKVLDNNHRIFEMVPDDLLDENIVRKSIRDVRSVLIFQNRNKACIDKFKSLISQLIDVHVLRNVQYNTGKRIQIEMEKLSESQLEILVEYDSLFFNYFPFKYKFNRNIVFSFIKKVEECFQHCSYRDDEEIIQYVLEKNPKFITDISSDELRFKYEQQYAKEILEVDPTFYASLSESSLKDRLFAKLAMKGCKSQRDFDSNFNCLPEDLKTQDFFIEIITENSKTFHNLKDHLDHDSLVQVITPSLYFTLEDRRKMDRDILRKILSDKFSSEEIEKILNCLSENYHTHFKQELFENISKERVLDLILLGVPLPELFYYQHDADFILKIITRTKKGYFTSSFLKDSTINISNIGLDFIKNLRLDKQGFSHLIHAIEVKEQGNELMQKCSDDIELVNEIIEIYPALYENLSCNNLRNNQIIIETYLNHTYFPRLSKDLKLDDEFQAKHLKKLIGSGYITKPNRELVRSGIFKSKDIGLLLYLETKDLDDKEFMLPILEKFPRAYLSCRSLLIDKEIIKMVIRKYDEIYEHLDTTFQKDEEILSVLNEPKSSIDSIMAEINDNTSE
ncbi:predicted protein [Naegleria gruberi]|uniref:Predicted protein n=1 Tax=Naegleria gruberi TaxID=5762 RepID=D2VUB4_NAEGR|nr:uncharacterized protein NAEGRDRAFT_59242 [Naegleria gruberi]EFC39662.1 predicted protein [Naegleria gruberi]|eukprot:XP_002672406.1 predicted protein [Naegleria gruberi strain NEG-M]